MSDTLTLSVDALSVLRAALDDAQVALTNLIDTKGHESIRLRLHPKPCNPLDFCVMHDAIRRLAVVEEARAKLAALGAKPR